MRGYLFSRPLLQADLPTEVRLQRTKDSGYRGRGMLGGRNVSQSQRGEHGGFDHEL